MFLRPCQLPDLPAPSDGHLVVVQEAKERIAAKIKTAITALRCLFGLFDIKWLFFIAVN